MSDLLKIRHIKFTFPLIFNAQKMTIRNNLETIIIDLTKADSDCGEIDYNRRRSNYTTSHSLIIKYLVRASTAAHKVVLK